MSPEEAAAAAKLVDLLANRTHDVHGGMFLVRDNVLYLRDEDGLGRKMRITVEPIEEN